MKYYPSLGRMAGFSIVEMMVSITIGLMVIVALTGVLVSNSNYARTNEGASELQSNGRYAMVHLRNEILHAGFRGYTWAMPQAPTGAINVTNECAGNGSGFVTNITQRIWGSNDSNPFAANCLNAGYLRGDVLVLRRVALMPATNCAAAPTGAATVYFRSTFTAGMVYQGIIPPPTIVGSPCADYALVEYVYYIGSDDTDPNQPALRRVALFTDGTMQDELVVSGIEQLQVQYGRSTTDGNTRYANSFAGTATESAASEWFDVDTARIWLLARAARAEPGYNNTGSYAMGDQNYTVNDGFRRQVFTGVIQMRNFHG